MKRIISVLMCIMILLPFSVTVKAGDDAPFSRMEALMLILEAVGYDKRAVEEERACPFADVEENYKVYVGYAYYRKITEGISDFEFAPERGITREEFLSMVLRLLGYNMRPSSSLLYERAELCGIYPIKYDGKFTRDEAKGILTRALFAHYYSNGTVLKDLSNITVGDKFVALTESEIMSPYQKSLSEVSSKLGSIEYSNDLPSCRILFGYGTYGAMHGRRGNGYVVFKDNGEVLALSLFYKDNYNITMPDEITVNESGTELYYTYTCEKDIVNPWTGVEILQEAGYYKYTINLETRQIVRQFVE